MIRVEGDTTMNARRLALPAIGLLLCCAAGLLLDALIASPPASAVTIRNDDCLGCHADRNLKKSAGGKSVSLFTNQTILAGSVHGQIECVGCHAGIREVPHPETLPPPTCRQCHTAAQAAFTQSAHGKPDDPGLECQSCHGAHDVKPAAVLAKGEVCGACHGEAVQAYRASSHGKAQAAGVKEAAGCQNCHGATHAVISREDPASPTHRTRMAETCAACHADQTLVARLRIPVPQAFHLYQKSVHGRAVAEGRPGATCDDCHSSHDIRPKGDPRSLVFRKNIPTTCGQCHRAESTAFLESIHGVAVERGNSRSPVCSDCHGEHAVAGTQDPTSRVSLATVSRTCASCHDSLAITEAFGLSRDRVSSFQDSFHGLAARGGNLAAANCASCHGTHDIRPSSDPRSSIHPANVPKTCGVCHPGAGENFAKGPVHVVVSKAGNPVLYYVTNFYLLMIVLTIGGMAAHNGLDFLKKLRREYRRHGGGEAAAAQEDARGRGDGDAPRRWYLRMTGFERIQHALLASSFLVLVYTGFALTYPESWPFRWFSALEQGHAIRGWGHRAAALAMTLACLLHLVYLPTRRGRRFLLDMLPRLSDVRELTQQLGYLVGLRAEPARFDRFGYIEKAEYWALIWGSMIMAVTGYALWFETAALRFVPLWVLDVATYIHFYEALLAALAIAVWHFYYVIFNPDVYPVSWAWLTGKIPEETMRHEHPRELERLEAEAAAEAERAAEAAAREAARERQAGETPKS
ncbi:MAG: cytochrome b/b6 domain-containing protein [Candidatus Methylomirabilota bacterium]